MRRIKSMCLVLLMPFSAISEPIDDSFYSWHSSTRPADARFSSRSGHADDFLAIQLYSFLPPNPNRPKPESDARVSRQDQLSLLERRRKGFPDLPALLSIPVFDGLTWITVDDDKLSRAKDDIYMTVYVPGFYAHDDFSKGRILIEGNAFEGRVLVGSYYESVDLTSISGVYPGAAFDAIQEASQAAISFVFETPWWKPAFFYDPLVVEFQSSGGSLDPTGSVAKFFSVKDQERLKREEARMESERRAFQSLLK